jgi:putative transposase
VRHYRLGAHAKSDLKVHLVWVPKYRKAILVGDVAVRVRDLLRQIAAEHELEIVSGKVASDHVYVFVSYRPNQDVSQIVHWRRESALECCCRSFLRCGRSSGVGICGTRGYLAVSSGTITDDMIRQYIDEQEGEQIADDSRFPIDNP